MALSQSAFARDFKALNKPGNTPTFFIRGSRSLVNVNPKLSKRVRRHLDEELYIIPQEVLRVVKGLAGGTKTAYPYVTGNALRSLKAVKPVSRPEGPLGMITTSAPYGRALERGAWYDRQQWKRLPGRHIRKAYSRWARGQLDRQVEAALERAIERAGRRREKIDVQVGG